MKKSDRNQQKMIYWTCERLFVFGLDLFVDGLYRLLGCGDVSILAKDGKLEKFKVIDSVLWTSNRLGFLKIFFGEEKVFEENYFESLKTFYWNINE